MDVSHSLTKYPIAFTAVSFGNDIQKISVMLAGYIKMPIHKGWIVTLQPDNTQKYIEEFGYKNDIDVITYDNLDLSLLKNIKNTTILFDSLSNLELAETDDNKGLDIIEMLIKNHNWIIFVGDARTKAYEIKLLSEKFPRTHFWNDKFADFGNCINFSLNKSKMSEQQELRYSISEAYYMETMKLSPNKDSWKSEEYPNLKRFCNIVYPGSIQNLIESPNIENPDLVPTPEKVIQGLGIPTVVQNAPKLQQLIHKVNFSRRKKNIIFTNFPNFFGTGIITAILNKLEIPTLKIDSEQTLEENMEIMKKFNTEEEYKVLVTNVAFPEPPLNIGTYHILDSNLPEAYEKIFQIYKYDNYTESDCIPPKLNIEMYCTSKSNDKSIDDYTFDEFFPYVLTQRDFWKFVKESSLYLTVNSKNRLDAVV